MKLIALMTLLLPALLLSAGDPLFEANRTAWQIWLPAKAAPAEQYAAEELQAALRKISGVEFQLTQSEKPGASGNIVIASLDSYPELPAALKLKAGDTEELAVYTLDGNLYLCGNNPRGALYAVYSFLQNELGVRWFWPGDDGEFIVQQSSYALPTLAYNAKPGFRFREMTPCGIHYHVPTEIWMARNFLNGGSRTPEIRDKAGFYRLDGLHTIAVHSKDFDKYPEYFSLINGKRVPEGEAGCWSNPGFTELMIKNHVEMIKTRGLDILNAFPADIVPRCECAECTKNPDPSSRWYDYYYKLIQEIKKECPDTMFAGIAYQEYRAVPTSEVKGLEYVEYCQYNRCYVHKLDNPECTFNQKSMEELKRWQAKAPMGIYGYEFDVFVPEMYVPFWNMLADEMKIFRDMKLVRMKTELGVGDLNLPRTEVRQLIWRLPNYIYARLLWNPDENIDALLADFCKYVYGPAAEPMLAYHKMMAASWDGMKIHLSYFLTPPLGTSKHFLNAELIKSAQEKFAAAEAAVQGDANTRFRAEVALDKSQFGQWEKLYQLSRDNAATATLPLLSDDPQNFARLGALPMKSANGTALPTQSRMFWSKDALHIQVICTEPDMAKLKKGASGVRDVALWADDNIEIFLDPANGLPYRHFAANPSGGTYDALGNDKNWDPAWQAQTTLEADRWITNIRIPFASLEVTPKDGDQWQIIVIRNSKPEASGYPFPAYHDMSGSATLYFSTNNKPEYRLSWISTPALAEGRRFEGSKNNFLKSGWQIQNAIGPEGAAKLDLSDSKLIVIENYQNQLPLEFYRDKLIPAVKNGAVVVFSCYFWVHELEKQFNDPTYKVGFIEKPHPVRKATYISPDSFATTPHNMKDALGHTPSGVFEPAFPDKWVKLACQKLADETEKPYIMARPLGKGMVVLAGDIGGNVKLFENLFEYNKAIKR